MGRINLYQSGHLFVAAMRILEYRHKAPPTVQQVASMLGMGPEQAGRICRKLVETGIVREIESGSQIRLLIQDHLELEGLPRETENTGLDKELQKFQAKRRQMDARIETIKQEREKKKKALFAEVEKKLKQDLSNKPE